MWLFTKQKKKKGGGGVGSGEKSEQGNQINMSIAVTVQRHLECRRNVLVPVARVASEGEGVGRWHGTKAESGWPGKGLWGGPKKFDFYPSNRYEDNMKNYQEILN